MFTRASKIKKNARFIIFPVSLQNFANVVYILTQINTHSERFYFMNGYGAAVRTATQEVPPVWARRCRDASTSPGAAYIYMYTKHITVVNRVWFRIQISRRHRHHHSSFKSMLTYVYIDWFVCVNESYIFNYLSDWLRESSSGEKCVDTWKWNAS